MSDLPKGWVKCRLGDVLFVKNGYAFKSGDYSSEGIPLIRISDIQNGLVLAKNAVYIPTEKANFEFLVQTNDLLIAMSGATTGKVGIYNEKEKCLQNQRIGNFKIFSDKLLDFRYRNYFIFSLNKKIEVAAYGGAQPNISSSVLEDFDFLLPPLAEQKRIVTKLDSLFAHTRRARQELDHIPKLIERYKQAILSAAFRGDLTADWRKENPQTNCIFNELIFDGDSENYEFFNLDPSWILSSIGKIGIVKGGKRLPKGEKLVEWNTGFPYIRAGNLKNATVITEDLLFITENIREVIKNYTVSSGDVYITIVGACIDDAGIIPESLNNANLTENAAKICNLKQCNNQYLSLWLRSPMCQDIIDAKTLSAAQGKLALTRIKTIPIPLPSIKEQKEMVKRVGKNFQAIDRLEQEYQKAMKFLDRLEQSTLAKAFRGEIVPQDPNEEPASILLERIQKERENQQKPKKRQLSLFKEK
jgi:type I restriction enzyme S subunit